MGTLYIETYTSKQKFKNGVPYCNAMIGMYCDEPLSISRFHRLPHDELWHFYGGDPLRLVLLHPNGSSEDVIMGNDPLKGHLVQFVIRAGVWQAGHMVSGGQYSLFGCTMAPGFTGDSFEGGDRERLVEAYPDRVDDIMKLGCDPGDTRMPLDYVP